MNIKATSIIATGGMAILLLAGCGANNNTVGGAAGQNTSGAGSGNAAANTTGNTAASQGADKVSALNVTPVVDPNAMPQPGEIVFGTDDTYPPMEYTDTSGRLMGFDVDLGDALGQVLHEKVVWKPTAWDGIIPGLTANKYDAILSTMNITPDREKQINFVPYGNFGQVIVVRSNHGGNIQSLADLKGKTVGVQIGTTSEDALKQEGGVNIKEYNTFPDAFQDLANGRLDAVVVDESVGRYYVAKAPTEFAVVGKAFQTEPVGIGLRKDETQLQQQLTQALQTLKKNGTYDKIYQYWFGTAGQ
ncbi:MAG: transporter substrate-binding domain-containing protein [Alicyclobacillus sp.]|nr:transporter substrate-binding domain-containing protein [Alicyclobacillus sp.]